MKNVQLISTNTILNNSIVDPNVDTKVIAATIQTTQDSYLRPILGDSLYDSLTEAVYLKVVSGTSLSDQYVTLLDKIEPYLVNRSIAEYVFLNTYKLTNKGVQKLNDNSAASGDESDVQNVRNYFLGIANNYKKILTDYLQSEKLVYNKEAYTENTGWFLGAGGGCVNSETSSSTQSTTPTTDVYLTGGTFSDSILTLTNNQGNSFSISGFTSGGTSNDTLQDVAIRDYTTITPLVSQVHNGQQVALVKAYYYSDAGVSNYASIGTEVPSSGGQPYLELQQSLGTDINRSRLEYSGNTLCLKKQDIYGNIFKLLMSGSPTTNHSLYLPQGDGYLVRSINGYTADTTGNVTLAITGSSSDTFVTGGTYSAGTITLKNNTGGTSTISGLYTGSTNSVSAVTFNNNILTVGRDGTSNLTALINNFSGVTTPTITANSGGTLTFFVGTGGTTQALTFNSSAAATFASSITSASNIIGLNVLSNNLVRAGAASSLQIQGRLNLYASADGIGLLTNGNSLGFNRLNFGAASSSWAALRVTGTTLEVRLGDDSNYTGVQSLYHRFGSGSPEGVVTAPVGCLYSRTDGGANTTLYVKESGSGNTGWVAK